MTTEQPHTPRRGVYLLPNLFTTATLFGGFYAIIAAIQADFTAAAIAIIAAGFADSMDGRIARLTNTQSDFGKEYDSLCDMIAFGLATAVVVYIWSLSYWAEYKWLGGKLGWVAAFTYTACAALRLARFNVSAALSGGKGDFHGLPSPAAAGVVICYVWASHDLGLAGDVMVLPSLIITLGAGVLMVSNIRYNSFKQVKVSERAPFWYMLALIGGLALVSLDPPRILFLIALAYALSGPIMALRRKGSNSEPTDDESNA